MSKSFQASYTGGLVGADILDRLLKTQSVSTQVTSSMLMSPDLSRHIALNIGMIIISGNELVMG